LEDAAVSAYGPSWEAQGRGRLTELAAQAAAQPEPPKPKPARISGRNPITAAGKQGRGGSRTRWILTAAAAAVVVGAGAGATTLLRGDESPPPDPAPAQSSSPQPSLPIGGVDPAPLVAQIDQAVAQAPGAQFTYRQTGCCGFPATAKGTFGLAQDGQPSYTLTLAWTGAAPGRCAPSSSTTASTCASAASGRRRPSAGAATRRPPTRCARAAPSPT